MGPGRWILVGLAAAVAATVVVVVVTRGGEPTGADAQASESEASRTAAASEVLDGPHVVLELCTGATCPAVGEAGQRTLQATLEDDPRVASALLVSSDQAYQLFLDRFGDQEELVASVRPEDVPARIELDLLDPAGAPDVVAAYEGHEGVASVYDARTVAP